MSNGTYKLSILPLVRFFLVKLHPSSAYPSKRVRKNEVKTTCFSLLDDLLFSAPAILR